MTFLKVKYKVLRKRQSTYLEKTLSPRTPRMASRHPRCGLCTDRPALGHDAVEAIERRHGARYECGGREAHDADHSQAAVVELRVLPFAERFLCVLGAERDVDYLAAPDVLPASLRAHDLVTRERAALCVVLLVGPDLGVPLRVRDLQEAL